MERSRVSVFAICATCVIALCGAIPFLPQDALAARCYDDAYYYFTIARHAAAGHGFTFDGIHPTNGFQPLWLFLLIPVYRIFGSVSALYAVALLQSLLVCATSVLLFFTVRKRMGTEPAIVAALALFLQPEAAHVWTGGMESSLLLLLLAAIWTATLSMEDEEPTTAKCAFIGTLCALAFLARVEAILVFPLVLWWHRRRFLGNRKAMFVVSIPVAVTCASYFLWNVLAFGVWLPVSGMVKTAICSTHSLSERVPFLLDFPWPGRWLVTRMFGVPYLLLAPPRAYAVYAALCVAVAIVCWKFRRGCMEMVRRSGAGFPMLAALAMGIADLGFVCWMEEWQRVAILLSVALLCGAICSMHRKLARVALLLLLLLGVAHPIREFMRQERAESQTRYRIEAAMWLRNNTDPGTRVGSWNAGMLGYFSERPVVNLDGLVNDAAYFRNVVRGHRLKEYLDSQNIGLIADQVCGSNPRAGGYLSRSGSEFLESSLQVRAVFFNRERPDGCPGYAIWSKKTTEAQRH